MKKFHLVLVFFLSFVLTSCSMIVPPSYKKVDTNVDNLDHQFNQNFNQDVSKTSNQLAPIEIDSKNTSDRTWLKSPVTIRVKSMPLSKLSEKLLKDYGVYNSFGPGVDQSTPVSFYFKGNLQQVLDLIATKTGYAYTIDGRRVAWTAFVTKTFDVSFMPGTAKYMLGDSGSTSGGGGSASGGGSSGGVGGTMSGATGAITSNGQYSSMEGSASLWADLQDTVKNMLSDKGKATISQATTTVTVTDYPDNVRQIQNYLSNMNQSLSRQVALDVQVLEITLNKDFVYGVDWGLAGSVMANRFGVQLNTSPTSTLNPDLGTSNTIIATVNRGKWTGSQAIIDALSQQGKVSVATQPRVVTLNNQVAQIGINTEQTYLAEISTNVVSQGPTTTTLTPGQVVYGFTLYLLPKVQGQNVYLQISSIISNLVSIQPYPPTTSSSSSTQQSQIYAPTVQEKRFNQRSLVPSGSTLVLAGFKQLTNAANKSSVFGVDSLGGYGGEQKNVETIVLITPIIVNLNN